MFYKGCIKHWEQQKHTSYTWPCSSKPWEAEHCIARSSVFPTNLVMMYDVTQYMSGNVAGFLCSSQRDLCTGANPLAGLLVEVLFLLPLLESSLQKAKKSTERITKNGQQQQQYVLWMNMPTQCLHTVGTHAAVPYLGWEHGTWEHDLPLPDRGCSRTLWEIPVLPHVTWKTNKQSSS